jgi:hypothetical protein
MVGRSLVVDHHFLLVYCCGRLVGLSSSSAFGFVIFNRKKVDLQVLALQPPPNPGPDGRTDWKAYGGDADVILINVDQATAKCCFGSMLGQEVRDLPLGGR